MTMPPTDSDTSMLALDDDKPRAAARALDCPKTPDRGSCPLTLAFIWWLLEFRYVQLIMELRGERRCNVPISFRCTHTRTYLVFDNTNS